MRIGGIRISADTPFPRLLITPCEDRSMRPLYYHDGRGLDLDHHPFSVLRQTANTYANVDADLT